MAWYSQAPTFRLPPGRIAFHQIEFAPFNFAAGTVAQFARQAAAARTPLSLAEQRPWLCGLLPGLRPPGFPFGRWSWPFWDSLPSTCARNSPNARVDDPSTSLLPSFVFVWPSNCGCGTAQRDDGGQTFSEIVSRRAEILEEVLLATVVVERAR